VAAAVVPVEWVPMVVLVDLVLLSLDTLNN
jgi:hypothetical protein